MHRITSDPRAGKVTDTKHQCSMNHTEAADGKIFWLSAAPRPHSDPVVVRQAESARRLRRASAAPQQCSRNSAEDCPLAASLNLAEIRSMIDLLRVATVLVSHCVRKHTRTSATQTSLRHPPSAPILSGLYVYNGRSDESGGYGTIPNAPSLTLAVGFRNENPPSNLHQHQCLQSLHTLITMRSCRGNFPLQRFHFLVSSGKLINIHVLSMDCPS